MKTITLKDIPPTLHSALKQRAKINKRSLNKEALACLEMVVVPTSVDTHSLLHDIRTHRASLPGKLNDRLIHDALKTGRP